MWTNGSTEDMIENMMDHDSKKDKPNPMDDFVLYQGVKSRCESIPNDLVCPKCGGSIEYYIDDVSKVPMIDGDTWEHFFCLTCVCDWVSDYIKDFNKHPRETMERIWYLKDLYQKLIDGYELTIEDILSELSLYGENV